MTSQQKPFAVILALTECGSPENPIDRMIQVIQESFNLIGEGHNAFLFEHRQKIFPFVELAIQKIQDEYVATFLSLDDILEVNAVLRGW